MSLRQRVLGWFHAHPSATAWALIAPGLTFLLAFFLAPILLMFAYSFMPRNPYGGVEWGFTFDNYTLFFEGIGLNPLGDWLWRGPFSGLYVEILVRTVWNSVLCTVICLFLGYPVAWAIARGGAWKNTLMFLVILPFWTSFLVRTFALIFILRDSGLLNTVLGWVGLIDPDQPITFIGTNLGSQIGLVYGFLPFMILPIYTSLEKLDLTLLEAAEILGARPWQRFFRVILPLSAPGVVAGSLLVFIPALGSFLSSDLLGGAKKAMVGNLVQNQFTSARNWPFGSAASFVMMLLVLGAVMIYLRVRDQDEAMGGH